jgi:sialate O-acetylesterase
LPLQAEYKNGKLIISFQYAKGLRTSDQKPLRGFSIDGHSEVAAVIANDRVLIEAKQKPAIVYYGWKPYSDANLVNAENLPASSFKINVK